MSLEEQSAEKFAYRVVNENGFEIDAEFAEESVDCGVEERAEMVEIERIIAFFFIEKFVREVDIDKHVAAVFDVCGIGADCACAVISDERDIQIVSLDAECVGCARVCKHDIDVVDCNRIGKAESPL